MEHASLKGLIRPLADTIMSTYKGLQTFINPISFVVVEIHRHGTDLT